MKNLKKVLALVLVVATLFSFATVAGAKFNDDKSIQYNEAVDVMTALGVIAGYSDGTFRPTANVTRAQMAKMIAFVVSSGDDVGPLYASANKFADCANSWAKGYIAYAVNADIIVGFTDGSFRPDGSVTGAQTAKMLLCALGYDAQIQQYAVNWPANVIKDAKSAGLLNGLEKVNMNVAMTREQAAQMIFNALKADMVGYDQTGYEIALPDGTIIRQGASTPKAVANKDVAGKAYNGDADEVTQLCEEYFGGNKGLKLTIGASDDFKRTANNWRYNAKEIGNYGAEAAMTYNGSVKVSQIFKDLGKPANTTGAIVPTLYVNGAVDSWAGLLDTDFDADNGVTIGDASTIVEVYNTTDVVAGATVHTVKIIVVTYYFDEVSKVTAAKGDTAAYITIDGKRFETTSFAKGDMVLYTAVGASIKSVQLADSIEGKVSAMKGDDVTIGGVKYTDNTPASVNISVDDEGTFYLGINGEIVGTDTESTSGDYLYIYKVTSESNIGDDGMTDSATYKAFTVDAEGKVASYIISSKAASAIRSTSYTGVIAYTINSNGELMTATASDNISAMQNAQLTDDSATLPGGKYASKSTQYVFVHTANGTKLTVSTATSYKNVDMTSAADMYTVSGKSSNIASVVFVLATDSTKTATDDYYYLVDGEVAVTKNADGDNVFTVETMLKGETVYLELAADDTLTTKSIANGDVFKAKMSDGAVSEATKIAPTVGKVTVVGDGFIVVSDMAASPTTSVVYLTDDCETYSCTIDGAAEFTTATVAKDDVISYYVVGGTGSDAAKVRAIVINADIA